MSDVTKEGMRDVRPGRDALTTDRGGRRRRRGKGEMVPPAEFRTYYDRAVIKAPVWSSRDIAGYLFTGGLAGGSAVLAAGADLTDRPGLRRATRWTSAVAVAVSFAALVHDLGKPARFVNMLRVVKPSSPMSMGTWLLTLFGPAAGAAAVSEVAPLLPVPKPLQALLSAGGRPAGLVAGATGPLVMTYTAALISDTAVPVWHEAHRELPYLFAASAAAASGGMAAVLTPVAEAGPARALGVIGAAADLVVEQLMQRRLGDTAQPLKQGRPHTLTRVGTWGNLAGGALLVAGRRSRLASMAGGAALVVASVATRFAVFEAGTLSAQDPRYTVQPQRARLDERGDRALHAVPVSGESR